MNNNDNGAGHMEAIYFGDDTRTNSGSGPGPWIMADMDNGLYSGYFRGNNPNDPTIAYRFIHAVVKGDATNHWSIRGGNAQSETMNQLRIHQYIQIYRAPMKLKSSPQKRHSPPSAVLCPC